MGLQKVEVDYLCDLLPRIEAEARRECDTCNTSFGSSRADTCVKKVLRERAYITRQWQNAWKGKVHEGHKADDTKKKNVIGGRNAQQTIGVRGG
jgi:hypothetical protein